MCLSITFILLEEDFKKNLWVNWLESSVVLAHTMTCRGWPDPQVLSQSFAINFRMRMIGSKVGWVPLPPRSPDSSTWLPQPGWRGATQKVWLFTWHFVLYLARSKRCLDLPGLGSFSGTRWWAICVRLWRTLRSVGLRRVRHISHPYTQASPQAIYLPFSEGWRGLCEHRGGPVWPAVTQSLRVPLAAGGWCWRSQRDRSWGR